jgi:hypothetical protein
MIHHQHANVAGLSLPGNDEGHRANDAPRAQTLTNTLDFAEATEHGQAFAAMKARAARCGCTLHQLADDTYLLTRWNCCRALPCLRAVGDFLRQMGGRP